eukprot:725351-Prymnesium_polylepis.1
MLTDETAVVSLAYGDIDEPTANLTVTLTALPGKGVTVTDEASGIVVGGSALPYTLAKSDDAKVCAHASTPHAH